MKKNMEVLSYVKSWELSTMLDQLRCKEGWLSDKYLIGDLNKRDMLNLPCFQVPRLEDNSVQGS